MASILLAVPKPVALSHGDCHIDYLLRGIISDDSVSLLIHKNIFYFNY